MLVVLHGWIVGGLNIHRLIGSIGIIIETLFCSSDDHSAEGKDIGTGGSVGGRQGRTLVASGLM